MRMRKAVYLTAGSGVVIAALWLVVLLPLQLRLNRGAGEQAPQVGGVQATATPSPSPSPTLPVQLPRTTILPTISPTISPSDDLLPQSPLPSPEAHPTSAPVEGTQ